MHAWTHRFSSGFAGVPASYDKIELSGVISKKSVHSQASKEYPS